MLEYHPLTRERLDNAPMRSVACFFLDRSVRGKGVTLGLLDAAVAYARSQGARIIESYPVEPGPRLCTYMGAPATFLAADFVDITPPNRDRHVIWGPRMSVSSK